MRSHIVLGIVIASWLTASDARAQMFVPTSGDHFWNVASNWSPPGYPDASGATSTLSAPTGDLTIDLGEEITVGTLTVNKSTSGDFDTTITGTTTNKLIFDGGGPSTLFNESSLTTGAGVTTVAAPVEFASPFTVTQRDDGILQFTQPLLGAGGLTINRASSDLNVNTGVVELNAENTYTGATSFAGAGNGDTRYLVVRLNHAAAIPSSSPLTLSNSAILEWATDDPFTRSVGTGPGQIIFTSPNFSGFSAFGGDRIVNLGGNEETPIQVSFVAAGFGNTLTLGAFTSNAMVDFKNPLDLGTDSGTRSLRSENGSAAIDGRISGSISGSRGVIKTGTGVLSLAAANIYAGSTNARGGVLRLDHPDALPSGNLILGSDGVLGLGAGDFARDLGTGANQVQFVFSGGTGNGGFSAHGANRTVVLNGGADLTWEAGNFMIGNGSLILSDLSADSTLDFQNPIDLNAAARTVLTRNGSAAIDGKLSGVISGTGSLIKTGGGTLELTAANVYDGGTTIEGGRLLVNNTGGSGTGTGPVTVNAGTLGGTGSVSGLVTVNTGGHVAPGASIGTLTATGGLTLETGSILDFELGAPGTGDLINTSALTINGVGSVILTDVGGLAGGNYTLIDYGTVGGPGLATFLSQQPTGPAGFNYALSDTGSTIDLSVTAIPMNNADFNDDGIVDAADYVVWRKFDGTTGTGTQGTGDANGDTNVDATDYDIWVGTFGTMPTGSGGVSGASVPEPCTIALLALPAIMAAMRRRRALKNA